MTSRLMGEFLKDFIKNWLLQLNQILPMDKVFLGVFLNLLISSTKNNNSRYSLFFQNLRFCFYWAL